jgi:hypothetical protein
LLLHPSPSTGLTPAVPLDLVADGFIACCIGPSSPPLQLHASPISDLPTTVPLPFASAPTKVRRDFAAGMDTISIRNLTARAEMHAKLDELVRSMVRQIALPFL